MVFAALCQVFRLVEIGLFGRIEVEVCWYLPHFGSFNVERQNVKTGKLL